MKIRSLILVILALLAFVPAQVTGFDTAQAGPIGPQPPRAQKGDQCVAPTPDMRRYHMNYLDHHRDDTVHKGVRTKQFSLKGCIQCHAVKGKADEFIKVDDPKHFCRVCHDYTAVKMDCFECHASRPLPGKTKASLTPAQKAGAHAELEGLKNFLTAQNQAKRRDK